MSEEGFEEWDADFLDQLIQVEELALSATQQPPPPPSRPPPQHRGPSLDSASISYSPPRELSQRTVDCNTKSFNQSSNGSVPSIPSRVRRSGNAHEVEIDRLKKELGRVSKHLTHLEQECLELRKERDKKEEQLKSVFSQTEAKDAEVQKNTNVGRECGVLNQDHSGISLQCRNVNTSSEQVAPRVDIATSTSKAIGVQTDKDGDSTHSTINSDLPTHCDLSYKLLAIWGSSNGKRSGRNLVSKLLVACAADFHVLFGWLNVSNCSKITADSLIDGSLSDVALQNEFQSFHSFEAAKVSHFYTILTKIGNGMVQLEALFEALLNLCNLENVVIVYRSLRILHVVLNHLLNSERKSERSALYSGTTSWLKDFALGATF